MKNSIRLTLLIALSCTAVTATPAFTTIPANGQVFGQPGGDVGWGFTITNDTSDYLFFDNSAFCGVGGDPFLNSCTGPYDGVTNFGPFGADTYTDFIAANLTFVAPNSTLTQTFDPIAMTGVGEYFIDPSTPVGTLDVGNLFVQYTPFNGNPLTTGTPDGAETELSAPVQVSVTPEPGTFTLAAGAIALLAAMRRKRSA